MSNSDGYYGTQGANSRTSEFNSINFIVRSILDGRAHVELVQVLGVEDGLLNVQPMVNQIDADGNAIPHGQVNGIPFFTLQAGSNAVTMTPEPGDIGVCLFADRDISSVKTNRAVSNPGSLRQSDMADGLYMGGFLNSAATQFIEFTEQGIRLVSPTKIRMEAPVIEMVAQTEVRITAPDFIVNGNSQFNGDINSTGTISAPEVIFNGIASTTHRHSGVQTGGGNSGGPIA